MRMEYLRAWASRPFLFLFFWPLRRGQIPRFIAEDVLHIGILWAGLARWSCLHNSESKNTVSCSDSKRLWGECGEGAVLSPQVFVSREIPHFSPEFPCRHALYVEPPEEVPSEVTCSHPTCASKGLSCCQGSGLLGLFFYFHIYDALSLSGSAFSSASTCVFTQLFQTLSPPTQLSAVGAHEIGLFETSVCLSVYRWFNFFGVLCPVDALKVCSSCRFALDLREV